MRCEHGHVGVCVWCARDRIEAAAKTTGPVRTTEQTKYCRNGHNLEEHGRVQKGGWVRCLLCKRLSSKRQRMKKEQR